METRVQKWGNSLALRIPRAYASEMQIAQESLVDISLQDGALVVRPLPATRHTLQDLLAGVTQDNLHHEVDYGAATGDETW